MAKPKNHRLVRHCLLILLCFFAWATIATAGTTQLPDFSQYSGVAKKQAFFDYLRPVLVAENQRLLENRALLKLLLTQPPQQRSSVDRDWLSALAKDYRVSSNQGSPDIKRLLRRVDAVPVALALTQAAIESAWGTSRFARLGNNLFGQWCYQAGCGIVPLRRTSGATHEVRKFDDVSQSVRAYLHNLNTHRAYKALRERRADLRYAQKPVTATALARTLTHYSERGNAYVQDLLRFINHNQPLMQEKP